MILGIPLWFWLIIALITAGGLALVRLVVAPRLLKTKLPNWVYIVLGAIFVIGGMVTFYLVNGLVNMWPAHTTPIACSDSGACSFWHPVIYSLIVILLVVTGFAYTTLLERKFIAYFQQRVGPNRVGPGGFLQPAADGIKLIFKEDIMPAKAYKAVYLLAPIMKAVPVLIVIAVIPLGPPIVMPWFDGNWYRVPLHVADPNVGVLWLLAITSIATYGVTLAGWSSNNKYAMLGGLRASAQMISYELSLGLSMVVPIMLASSMSIGDIIAAQAGSPLNWFVFQNPLAAAILMITLVAEVNRAPFDLPEAEQELTAGHMTEYSGMKFALFMMAEYIGMIAISLIAVSLFFGGFHLFDVSGSPILAPLIMIGKVIVFLIGLVWVRATLPRIRYDRLMSFGWKVLLPLSLLAVIWTAVALVISDAFGQTGYLIVSGVLFVLIVAGAFWMFGRDGSDEAEESDLETDPIITGARRDVGYIVMQALGGLVALPFLLYNWTLKLLEGLAGMGERASKKSDDSNAVEKPSGGD